MRKRVGWRILSVGAMAVLGAALPLLAGGVFVTVDSLDSSGEAPMITKTGTLSAENRYEGPMTNVRATLRPSEDDTYTVVDGTVEFPTVDVGSSATGTDTFAVEIDTSDEEQSPSVPLWWDVEFDQGGEHHTVPLVTVIHVTELE